MFRTYDSVDEFVKKKSAEDIEICVKKYEVDKYLDSSINGRYLNDEVLSYLKKFLSKKKIYMSLALSV